jgi:hypothetical protein
MNDFATLERNRAFARVIEHLRAAHGHVRAAEIENVNFGLNLGELAAIDRTLLHEIHCCAHVYKQPPETPS